MYNYLPTCLPQVQNKFSIRPWNDSGFEVDTKHRIKRQVFCVIKGFRIVLKGRQENRTKDECNGCEKLKIDVGNSNISL